jgi:DNA-binding CsgD family transcriptional regulator
MSWPYDSIATSAPNRMPPLLVGREREGAALREHFRAALAGQGSLVLIGGEAGIGKTALAETVCREAEEQGALVLVGRCYDLTETPPYGPWMELFGRYRPTDGAPPLPAAFAQRGAIGAVASQAALLQQVRDFFAALVEERPAVLLLDDLHWSDPASLDLLRFLARSLAALPLLVVVTYRANELDRRHPLSLLLPLLEREAPILRLALRPLSPAALRSLLAARYRLSSSDTDRLVAYLHARAEGNAFFTVQLLRSLENDDIVRLVADSWLVGDLAATRIPSVLREVINGQVVRFGDGAQELLEMAAVIGQDVPLGVWAAASGVDEAGVTAVVERAMAARLMDETPDGTQARFVHALVRDALYEGISPSRRRSLHQQAGEALAALPNPDTDAIADHFRRAVDARAIAWLIESGYRAQQVFALITAADRYEAALRLMDQFGAEPTERGWLRYRLALTLRYRTPDQAVEHLTMAERIAAETGDHPLGGMARFTRGFFMILMNATLPGLAAMRAGLHVLDALPDEEQQTLHERARVESVEDLRAVFAYYLALTGHLGEAAAITAAIGTRDSARPARVDRTWNPSGDLDAVRGIIAAFSGAFVAARHSFAAARVAYHTDGHFSSLAYMPMLEMELLHLPYRADRPEERGQLAAEATAMFGAALDVGIQFDPRLGSLPVWWLEGRWEDARALAAAREMAAQDWSTPSVALVIARIAHACGDSAAAWEQIDAVFPDGPATAPGTRLLKDALPLPRLAAVLACDAGDRSLACSWLEAHDRWLAWSGAMFDRADGYLAWARFFHAFGDAARAVAWGERAVAAASEPRQPLVLLGTHRLLGELDRAAEQYEAAKRHLDISLTLAVACHAPYERALTLLALAELRAATGEIAMARELLVAVRAICEPLGAATLDRAKALAARFVPPPVVTAARSIPPAHLSDREMEVLRLLAAGRTNREIAVTLFISVHTVNAHVKTILGKTGSANRVEAAAFAHAHHLI